MNVPSGPIPPDPVTVPEAPTTRTGDIGPAPATGPHGAEPEGPVGGYRLLSELARGGMGVVYRATDLELNRDVAVKVLHDRLRDHPAAVRRFLDEARITGQLQHPGVPPVHQVGTLPDGRPFLAMKLIKGRTLADRLADPAADRGALLGVFEQICQAVGYAHSHGVIHRDLKPQNVMVGRFGEVQVMDWGLAKYRTAARAESPEATAASTFLDPRADDTGGSETRAGSVLGTPAYMPPEQAIGAVDQVDERSDVFGLGAILCAVLTGKPPFVGSDSESTRQLAARAKLDEAYARLDTCGAEPELVALCKRCLSPEKADRPADAGVIATAVAGLRAAADERARRAEVDRARAQVAAAEQRKRRRVQLALAAAVGLLLLGGGAGGWFADRQAGLRRADADRRDHDERERLTRNAAAIAGLLDRCADALRADDAAAADLALDQAERRAADGGSDAGRLARCRADLDVLRALDRVDDRRWAQAADRTANRAAVVAGWAEAFRRFGIVPGETAPTIAAGRVGESLVRERLLAALDQWLARDPADGVLDILREADPDDYRTEVRRAVRTDARDRVAELAADPRALDQPIRFAVVLADVQGVLAERRDVILHATHRRQPNNLFVLMALGELYPSNQREWAAERAGWFRAALAVRPTSPAAWNNLGSALHDAGDLDGARAAFRESARLDPADAKARQNLGLNLFKSGDLDGAIALYREAIRLDPTLPAIHGNLGVALRAVGDLDGAIASYREVSRLDPTDARAPNALGNVLTDLGDLDAAVAAYREAIRLDPKSVGAHNGLGVALDRQGDLDAAAAALREAARLDPKSAVIQSNLGGTERRLEMVPRLPEVAAGRARPKDPADACEFAALAARQVRRQYLLAVRLYAGVFATDTAAPADLVENYRYDAACAAALAAAGRDAGGIALGVEEWGYLTDLAHRWLRADLARADAKQRAAVRRTLTRWKRDPALTAIRDPAWLAAMPAGDRQRWEALWAEVDALLATVSRPPAR